MPELNLKITGIEAATRGLIPLINFNLEVTNVPETEVIHTVTLQTQIQIQAPQRAYNAREKEKLSDLFGSPEQWGQTLRGKLWTHAQTVIRSFSGSTTAQFSVPCTFDLNVMATKYFYALEDGEVPLLFLFSGTVFYEANDGRLQVQQISWDKECTFRLPVKAWQDLMDHHYPNTAWITLHRDALERLYAYRRTHGLTSWDETIEALVAARESMETAP